MPPLFLSQEEIEGPAAALAFVLETPIRLAGSRSDMPRPTESGDAATCLNGASRHAGLANGFETTRRQCRHAGWRHLPLFRAAIRRT